MFPPKFITSKVTAILLGTNGPRSWMQHYATLNNTLLENRYCESLFSIIVKAIVEKKNYLKYVDKTSIKFIFKANLTFLW